MTIKKLQNDFSFHSELIIEAENSNDAERIGFIAYCLYMSGNVTPAIRYLNKAAELKRADPLTPQMVRNMQSKQSEGAYYKQILGNVNSYSPEEGIKIFSEFVQRMKCCQEGYSSLGVFYSRNMQLDNALKSLNDALLLDPYSADTFNNIAMVYDKMGMQNKAVDYIKQGLAISPDHAMLRRNLSLMQNGQCAIQYMLINVESGNDDPGFIQEIVDDYKGEYDNLTKITAYNCSLDVLQKEEADIIKYGNNMDLVDWIDNQELKVKHGLSWAILTKYSKEQNVDLHGRSCYIDSKIKRGHRCIVIRIY
jgi:tetratricopeptide (TPR) repeat protein